MSMPKNEMELEKFIRNIAGQIIRDRRTHLNADFGAMNMEGALRFTTENGHVKALLTCDGREYDVAQFLYHHFNSGLTVKLMALQIESKNDAESDPKGTNKGSR